MQDSRGGCVLCRWAIDFGKLCETSKSLLVERRDHGSILFDELWQEDVIFSDWGSTVQRRDSLKDGFVGGIFDPQVFPLLELLCLVVM